MIVRRLVDGAQVMLRWGAFIDQKTRHITWSSGKWWRGLMGRRRIRGGPRHEYQISSNRAIPGPRTVIGGLDDRYSWTLRTGVSCVQYAQQKFRLGERAKTGVVSEKQRSYFEAETWTACSPKETTTAATQTTSAHPRADCQNDSTKQRSLPTIPSHASGPSAIH